MCLQHQGYTGQLSSVYINDIALLKLTTEVTSSDQVSEIRVAADDNKIGPDTECFITGWGISEKSKLLTDVFSMNQYIRT